MQPALENLPAGPGADRSMQAQRAGVRPKDMKFLTEILSLRAERDQKLPSHSFFNRDLTSAVHLTYGELAERAQRVAAALLGLGLEPAERVVLLLEPGPDYVAAFYGCLWCGMVAVPSLPTLQRAQGIVADCDARAIFTSRRFMGLESEMSAAIGGKRHLLCIEDALENHASAQAVPLPRPVATSGESLALLQYTSGSTGDPKGVMVTHANLAHLLQLTEDVQGYGPHTRMAGWLPPYHDLGLIGAVLQPLFSGFPVAMLSPLAFLSEPRAWLQLMTLFRATTSAAPNFAYAMCSRRISEAARAGLDLSHLSTLNCAGEPIRAATIEEFLRAFAPCGLSASAFQAAYGLAECTLEAAIAAPGAGLRTYTVSARALREGQLERIPEDADDIPQRLVSCGNPVQEILIVDPVAREPVSPGTIGEIWIRSPAVALGHWGKASGNADAFRAALADGTGPFLRTGDLGALVDAELVVTGRIKDLIILHGQNHYPQDIETAVNGAHAAVRTDCSAAFAVPTHAGAEALVIVVEVTPHRLPEPAQIVAERVIKAIKTRCRARVHAVVLAPPRTLPRTTSGKLQRQATRAAFLEGSLEQLALHVEAGVS